MNKRAFHFAAAYLIFLGFSASASTLYVDLRCTNPFSPYADWSTAATNIQDAIDGASDGDQIWVTNGIYNTGGKIISGTSNRVVLDKAITVMSVNGYANTIIQGSWDPIYTNGPLAVRCAYLTTNATLYGFTLENGATPSNNFSGDISCSGGGAFCAATNSIVSNCVLSNNSAIYGGAVCHGTLNNSLVIGNWANYGGGAYSARLNNCTVTGNVAPWNPFARGGGEPTIA